MAKRKRTKREDAGRRRFLWLTTVGMVMTRLSVAGGVWSLVKDFWALRSAPVVVGACGTAAGSSTAAAIGSVVLTAKTGVFVLTGEEVKLEIGRA